MDKLDHLGWVVSSSFAIGDVRFAVRSTSHAFGEWLSDALGAYEVDDVEEFLYSVVVPEPPADGKAKEFFILYKGSSAIVRTLDPVALGRGLLAELEGLGCTSWTTPSTSWPRSRQVRGEPVARPVLARAQDSRSSAAAPRNWASRSRPVRPWAIDLASAQVDPDPVGRSTCPGTRSSAGRRVRVERSRRATVRRASRGHARASSSPPRSRRSDGTSARKGYALANLTSWTLNLERTAAAGSRRSGQVRRADAVLRIDVDRCRRSDRTPGRSVGGAIVSEDDVDQEDRLVEEMSAGDIDGAFVPVPRADVTAVVLDGEAVLLAEGASEAHYLDEIGHARVEHVRRVGHARRAGRGLRRCVRCRRRRRARGHRRAHPERSGAPGCSEGSRTRPPPEPSFAWPTGRRRRESRSRRSGCRTPTGVEVALADLAERQVLLVNWSPRCGFCTRIAPELAELQPELQARGVEMVFITLGDAEENRPLLEEHGLQPRVLFGEGWTWRCSRASARRPPTSWTARGRPPPRSRSARTGARSRSRSGRRMSPPDRRSALRGPPARARSEQRPPVAGLQRVAACVPRRPLPTT